MPEPLIIDSFAGGGGASEGIRLALGRGPDLAINHDAEAVALHAANHPATRHLCKSVYQVDLAEECGGRPVGLLWASPDCTFFSKARGGQPIVRGTRDLAHVVVEYAAAVRPDCIILENVEEFAKWGPLDWDGRPHKPSEGLEFRRWVRSLRRLGYKVEWRELRACDFGAPTIRKRLFVIARCDGHRIVWPKPTHGDPRSDAVKRRRLLPWRTAAECIDWSIPCPSIFERTRPLAEATLRRIAKGVVKYVLEAAEPFIVTYYGDKRSDGDFRGNGLGSPIGTQTTENRHALVTPYLVGCGGRAGQSPERGVDTPYHTVTAKADTCLVAPTLIQTGYGERDGQAPRVPGLGKPLGTVVASGAKHALVAAFLATHFKGKVGRSLDTPAGTVTTVDHHSLTAVYLAEHRGRSVGAECSEPARTVTGRDHHSAVVANLTHFYSSNTCGGNGQLDSPMRTVTASGQHAALVAAFLSKYYSSGGQDQTAVDPLHTVPTKARFGLVTVELDGEPWIIADIGMRMLSPRELYRAQGFPDAYRIDVELDGRRLSKAAQVRMCGNSVCPPLAAALVRANVAHLAVPEPVGLEAAAGAGE